MSSHRTTTTDRRELRDCLGRFATGVTVITCRGDGAAHGATVNAFTAVSLDPPLVLVALDRRSKASRYLDGEPFAVNVLAADATGTALHFAGRPQDGIEVTWIDDAVAPRLAGAAAWLVCTPWARYDGGDHLLFVGEVQHFGHTPADPLLFHAGRLQRLGEQVDLSAPAIAGLADSAPWLESADCPAATGWLGGPRRLPANTFRKRI